MGDVLKGARRRQYRNERVPILTLEATIPAEMDPNPVRKGERTGRGEEDRQERRGENKQTITNARAHALSEKAPMVRAKAAAWYKLSNSRGGTQN